MLCVFYFLRVFRAQKVIFFFLSALVLLDLLDQLLQVALGFRFIALPVDPLLVQCCHVLVHLCYPVSELARKFWQWLLHKPVVKAERKKKRS